MVTERRNLQMHNKLLVDVIKRQAGTLHKAILEGIMNGIEAGATRIDIRYNPSNVPNVLPTLKITDDGKGIQTVQDIERFFETFGTPHEENEGKIWAQFRMGRGQLFAFGRNIWRTGEFSMVVDINTMGLAYDLTQNLPNVNGCTIDINLYKNPIPSDYMSLDALERSIRQQIEFMVVPVYFNGKRLNKDPKNLKWTFEDENAYYLFGVGNGLAVYNIGAYVTTLSAYNTGVTGVVCSKKQLKVNFARNEIQNDCEVYKQIKRIISQNRRDKVRKKRTSLSNDERTAMLLDLADGGIGIEDVKNLSLLRTTSGRAISLASVLRERLPWTFAPADDMKADKIMQRHEGIVLDERMMSCLSYDGEPKMFFDWLLKRAVARFPSYQKQWGVLNNLYSNFSGMAARIKDGYKILANNDLNLKERLILRILNERTLYNWGNRVVNIGMSETARAWTDGQTYIALDRGFVDKCNYGNCHNGIALIINVMAHELAHDIDSSTAHVHDEEFYRRFHDICTSDAPPQSIIAGIFNRLQKSRIALKQEKVMAREKRQLDKQDALLGVAASE